jgi:hypothetical protein
LRIIITDCTRIPAAVPSRKVCRMFPQQRWKEEAAPRPGQPQWQKYCLECARLKGEAPHPASLSHFNHSATRLCDLHHPQSIRWCVGCDRHRGCRDNNGQCFYCTQEAMTGVEVVVPSLGQTYGYPGDHYYSGF